MPLLVEAHRVTKAIARPDSDDQSESEVYLKNIIDSAYHLAGTVVFLRSSLYYINPSTVHL